MLFFRKWMYPAPDDGASGGTPAPAAPAAPAQPSANDSEAIADRILSAMEARTRRVESSVLKSMADQYHLTEAEVTEILDAERTKRASQIPAETQRLIDAQMSQAQELLIAAAVRAEGASLGLLDADAAALMMDRGKIKVDEKGAVTGVQEALAQLKAGKAYLFSQPAGVGGSGGNPPAGSGGTNHQPFAYNFTGVREKPKNEKE